jgi:hemolysin activation/secretion protein
VLFAANAVFPDAQLRALVTQYEGREVGSAELEAASARITQHYPD